MVDDGVGGEDPKKGPLPSESPMFSLAPQLSYLLNNKQETGIMQSTVCLMPEVPEPKEKMTDPKP